MWFMLALTLCAQFQLSHKSSVLALLSANITFDLVLSWLVPLQPYSQGLPKFSLLVVKKIEDGLVMGSWAESGNKASSTPSVLSKMLSVSQVGAPVSLWGLPVAIKICVKLIYMKAIEWPQSPTETVYGLRRTYQHCRAVYDVIYQELE